MEMPTFIYNVLPSKKREKLISERNVRVIKEFLRKREQITISKENDLVRLKQLRKDRSISKSTYSRLKQVVILSHNQKRIELIKASVEKSVRIGKSSVSYDEHTSEDNQPIDSVIKNN